MTKQVPIIVINGLLAFLLFYYVSIQVPVAGLLVSAFMPLPVILTLRRAGWLGGLLMVAAGVGAIYYLEHFSGLKAEVLPVLHMAVIGMAVFFLASRQQPLEIIVGGTVAVTVALQVAVFLVQAWQLGLAPGDHLQRLIAELWTAFKQVAEKDKLLEQEFLLAGLSQDEVIKVLAQVTPALLVINNTLVVLLNYLLSRHLGGRFQESQARLPLSCWEAPGWLVFVLIGSGFLLLVPYQALQTAGVNVLLVCGLIYFFQGLAIIAFSFNRFQVPRFIRWIAFTILVLVKPAMLLVMTMGVIDLWLDFRQLHRPPAED